MNPLSSLKQEIVAFNTELNVLEAAIHDIPATAFIRNLLKKKALKALEDGTLESKLMDKFADQVEAQAEGQSQYCTASFPPTSSINSSNKSNINDPFGEVSLAPVAITISKEEFLDEVATIYASELTDTELETRVRNIIDENLAEGETYDYNMDEQEQELAKRIMAEDKQSTVEAPAKVESFSLSITLNEKQLHAKEMALMGKSYVLIGAAGTGKTTAQRSVAESLLLDSRLSISTYKTYDAFGARTYVSAPSIAFVAYTRRAAANLRKAIHMSPILKEELSNNIMTIHSLLEYEPETYWDVLEAKEKFRFTPKRDAKNPLNITHLVIEEASMLGAHDLWPKLYDALPAGVQIIFIGDINQLPPVFGPSILNYALVQLPVVELTQVYRNQGVVLENAHNILAGKPIIETPNYRVVEPLYTDKKGIKVQAGQEKLSYIMRQFFESLYDKVDADGEREYDPDECIILSPWNKQAMGTDNMNKHIAQFLGARRKAIVHEILAGINKVYLAIGDKVMFNKRDGIITAIEKNSQYFGRSPQLPGSDLSRFGVRILGTGHDSLDDVMIDYSSFSLEALEEEKAERKQQASHVVTVTYDDGSYDCISATGDFAPAVFSLGYVLTVHKAQGSEWRKVFIIFHKDFAVSLYRELFYTAATRARTKVTIIATRGVIEKSIATQRIKGDSLKDKLEYFNSGADLRDSVYTTKG